jgi:hypothetical protein
VKTVDSELNPNYVRSFLLLGFNFQMLLSYQNISRFVHLDAACVFLLSQTFGQPCPVFWLPQQRVSLTFLARILCSESSRLCSYPRSTDNKQLCGKFPRLPDLHATRTYTPTEANTFSLLLLGIVTASVV